MIINDRTPARGVRHLLAAAAVSAAPTLLAAQPCGITLPGPGQTVTWDLAGSPYTVCQDLMIPAGGTVLVDPGVVINFNSGAHLQVNGDLLAPGTPRDPIVFDGSTSFGTGLFVEGHADLGSVVLDIRTEVRGDDAVLELRDSQVSSGGQVFGVPDLVVIERCEFAGGSITGVFGSLRLVDSTFTQGSFADLGGMLYLDNLTFDGRPLSIRGELIASPVLLDNISVTGYGGGAGVSMYGPNFLLGPNFITQGNLYPLEIVLNGAGLLPGSELPVSGNVFNHVPANGLICGYQRHWADTGIPYVVDGFYQNLGGELIIEPGTTLKMLPGAGAFIVLDAQVIARGTPTKPITFERADPGTPWFGLKWVDNFSAQQHGVTYRGAEIALQVDGGQVLFEDCDLVGNDTGAVGVTGGLVDLRSSRVLNNSVGMTTTSTGRLFAGDPLAPNRFEGNGLAVDFAGGGTPDFRNNWWGDPSGPTTPQNPGGSGDAVQGLLTHQFTPFLTSPPPQTDRAPVINLEPVYHMTNSGEKIILRWDSSDDSSVASHRIEFAPHAFPNEYRIVATLEGSTRSYEFTAPIVQPDNRYPKDSGIRVIAIDDAGHETFAEVQLRIPYHGDITPVYQEVQNLPSSVHPHDNIDVCWLPGGSSDVFIVLDDLLLSDPQGGAGSCLAIGATAPYASSDLARFLVKTTYGAGGRIVYSYSDYFHIRPDARFGDAPPSVAVSSPLGGERFVGGGIVPIQWDAADDEFVRTISLQGSYDGGKTWHSIARALDPSSSSFSWRLPASTGIADVRVRVVASDRRFQTSSATSAAFEILPGDGCPADFNGDGTVNTIDVLAFLNAWSASDPSADFNGDGTINTIDVLAFLNAWSVGC